MTTCGSFRRSRKVLWGMVAWGLLCGGLAQADLKPPINVPVLNAPTVNGAATFSGTITCNSSLVAPTVFANNDGGQVRVNEPSGSTGKFAKLTFGGAGNFPADAGIGVQFTSNGSVMHFGTSNSYPGITKDALQLDYNGNATIARDLTERRLIGNGTGLVTGDVALSAGWGTTATKAVTGTDGAGTITVTSSGTGQAANPTITLTFHDGVWAAVPVACANADTGGTGTALNPFVHCTTTTMVLTYPGTPVATSTYEFDFLVRS